MNLCGYQQAEVERLDIFVAEEIVESLAIIVYKDDAYKVGKKIVEYSERKSAQTMVCG